MDISKHLSMNCLSQISTKAHFLKITGTTWHYMLLKSLGIFFNNICHLLTFLKYIIFKIKKEDKSLLSFSNRSIHYCVPQGLNAPNQCLGGILVKHCSLIKVVTEDHWMLIFQVGYTQAVTVFPMDMLILIYHKSNFRYC